jgi:hypothetical protein
MTDHDMRAETATDVRDTDLLGTLVQIRECSEELKEGSESFNEGACQLRETDFVQGMQALCDSVIG